MASVPAMQSMPLLFRQSLRTTVHISRTAARPARLHFRPTPPSSAPVRPTSRAFSACLQCQFHPTPNTLEAFNEKNKEQSSLDPQNTEKTTKDTDASEAASPSDTGAGSPRAANFSAAELNRLVEDSTIKGTERGLLDHLEAEQKREREEESGQEQPPNSDGVKSGGLPSYLESRRSKMSKQFTGMMDNLQSNVFVAGQRLNDLTGYSGIEALKKEIHVLENRLRTARAQVREAKDAYSAAINNRSTSQREVNELLQRKHAWSTTDLERFTLLYRNDHTNEVAETETQEALAQAEREAEEAAAQLSKSILSRYHEEQVWSDKIRRMSTWGTWGLMGMNVLLFLIFQILVEPWRRRRLVKGFEDKIVEALEKEKAINQAALVIPALESVKTADAPAESSVVAVAATADSPSSEGTESAEGAVVELKTEDKALLETTSPADNASQTLYSRLAGISLSPFSLEYWNQSLNELLSDRSVAITQRELTVAAVQSAAAGAAVMGLLFALLKPR
ncbi:hypothetical protein N7466_002936 [Penicillium verhagenii]|uniref:uncharacterized protein n=1 Tax=Penicillium verhagenii TaxID=1562060 RepID=UPI002545838A|nr:uncharacterized protein N7466_002936 [Penicillium verhagenii]KAJ5939802.1 hypothetical protein N7466_002936 [Penicillium verhagenii]